MQASRRQFFGLLAAPAILRMTKPMALWTPKTEIIAPPENLMLTIDQITREAVRLFKNSNVAMRQYDDLFAKTDFKIGSKLRIHLPNDYKRIS